MPVYYDKARKRWRYEFSRLIEGRRQRVTKLLPPAWTARQAEAYGQAQDAKLYAVATGATREQPLISEAVHLYLEHHAPGLKNEAKLRRDVNIVEPWYRGRRMNELAEVAKEYQADCAELAPATVRNRLAYVRAACRWAWKHHRLGDHNPAERLAMPTVRNERHVYLTRAEVLRLCRAVPDWWARAVILVAFYSGMRLAEILRARPTERGWLLEDTKNGERRIVPIHPKTLHYARQWPPAISARTLQKRFAAGAEAIGRPEAHFHDLRHSAASAMINADVSLFTVGAVLGHRSPVSTKRYAHLATSTLEQAVAAITKRRA